MTRFIPRRFRRALLTLAVLFGAGGLALGTAAAASAAPAGGYPSPTPTVLYTPPPSHHHHKPPAEHCFLSLETEHDTLSGQPVGQQGYTAPAVYTDAYWGGLPQEQQATVEVVQLVKVCVEGTHVQVWDESGPFAWEIPASGIEPTPSGLPSDIKGMLAAA